jgi:MFS superfamily sulfate permease-like transporter
MYRFGAALFYANANRFAEEVNGLVGHPPSQVRWLIVDAEASTRLDYSAARVVRELQQKLTNCGTELGFARISGDLRGLRPSSPDRGHHPSRLFNRLYDALAAFERRQSG